MNKSTVASTKFGPLSVVSASSYAKLIRWFGMGQSRTSRSEPFRPEVMMEWRKFIFTLHKDQARFDTREWERWMKKNGWTRKEALSIFARIQRDMVALDEYLQMYEAHREEHP